MSNKAEHAVLLIRMDLFSQVGGQHSLQHCRPHSESWEKENNGPHWRQHPPATTVQPSVTALRGACTAAGPAQQTVDMWGQSSEQEVALKGCWSELFQNPTKCIDHPMNVILKVLGGNSMKGKEGLLPW